MKFWICSSFIIVLFAMFVLRCREIYIRIGAGKVFEDFASDETKGCTRVGLEEEDLGAVEDLGAWTDDILILSSDQYRLDTYIIFPENMNEIIETRSGGLWALNTITSEFKRLVLKKFPEGIAFFPHGIHVIPERGELFVINHAWSRGGERVEVFSVQQINGWPELTWKFSIKSDVWPCCLNLNDVVSMVPGEIFVSQWKAYKVSSPMTKWEHFVDHVSFFVKWGSVHRCTWDPKSPDPSRSVSCKTEPFKFWVPNGLTADTLRSTLYVSDPLDKAAIRTFKRHSDGSLEDLGSINSIGVVDNLEYNKKLDKIYAAGLPMVTQALALSEDRETPISGLVQEIKPIQLGGEDGTRIVVAHKGNALPMFSAAFPQNSYYWIGSPISGPGLLKCPTDQ